MSSAAPLQEIKSMDSGGELPEDREKRSFERTLWARVWQGLAVASIGLNVAAMAIEGPVIMVIAGVIAAIIAPFVIVAQRKLQDTDTLRDVQNALRKEVNRLQTENNKLSAEVNQLENQVGRLKDKETRLQEITKKQGTSIDRFVGLVKENRETLDAMKASVKADTMQTLVSAIIDSDFDSSANFSDQEIQILEVRMKNIPGVKVNHKKLVEAVRKSDRKLASVLALVAHLENDTLAAEDRIFMFDEQALTHQK